MTCTHRMRTTKKRVPGCVTFAGTVIAKNVVGNALGWRKCSSRIRAEDATPWFDLIPDLRQNLAVRKVLR